MFRGHEVGTCCSNSFSRRVRYMFLLIKFCSRNKLFLSVTFRMKFSSFEIVCHGAGTKGLEFSISHRVHCSCKLSPLQHILMPQSALCAPACLHSLQHASHIRKKGPVFASRLHNMAHSVCRILYASYVLYTLPVCITNSKMNAKARIVSKGTGQ